MVFHGVCALGIGILLATQFRHTARQWLWSLDLNTAMVLVQHVSSSPQNGTERSNERNTNRNDQVALSAFVVDIPRTRDNAQLVQFIRRGLTIVQPRKIVNQSLLSYRPLDHCNITNQVQLYIPKVQNDSAATSSSPWILQAVDQYGNLKRMGGDEFYVSLYRGRQVNVTKAAMPLSIAVAIVTDQRNGRYQLDFVTPPHIAKTSNLQHTAAFPSANHDNDDNDNGLTIVVHFVYTCGMGEAYQPLKHAWQYNGGTPLAYTVHIPHDWWSPLFRNGGDAASAAAARLELRRFVPPTLSVPSHLSNRLPTDLNSYETIVYFGDSMIQQLGGFYRPPDLAATVGWPSHQRPGAVHHANVRRRLCRSTAASWLESLEAWHGPLLLSNASTSNVALVTGSSAWDILTRDASQGPTFQDHLDSVRYFVTNILQRYPHVRLIWKLPSALVSACVFALKRCKVVITHDLSMLLVCCLTMVCASTNAPFSRPSICTEPIQNVGAN
jgi:hypothetical protein